MDDGINYTEVGRKQRIGDIVPDAMALRDRKPRVDMHVQIGHVRAAVSADADLMHLHYSGDIAGKRLDRGGFAADFSVHEFLKRPRVPEAPDMRSPMRHGE